MLAQPGPPNPSLIPYLLCSHLNDTLTPWTPAGAGGPGHTLALVPLNHYKGHSPQGIPWQSHSSTLAGEIPRTEEPAGLQSVGSQRVGHS